MPRTMPPPGTGYGMNLTNMNRGAMEKAAQAGNLSAFMQNSPQMQAKMNRQLGQPGAQADRIRGLWEQNFQANPAAFAQALRDQQAGGNPAGGGGAGKPPQAGNTKPPGITGGQPLTNIQTNGPAGPVTLTKQPKQVSGPAAGKPPPGGNTTPPGQPPNPNAAPPGQAGDGKAALMKLLNSPDPNMRQKGQAMFAAMMGQAGPQAQAQLKQALQQQGGGGQNGAGKPPQGGNAGPTYQDAMDAQFGADNPMGMRNWYGDNPLETAQAVAQRVLGQNLAGIRARYGAGGLGNSDRAALAEGDAMAQMATNLGDILAQRGEGAYQADAARGLQALLGAGNLQNANDALALQLNQQLGGFGTGLTGIGGQETQIPNLGPIIGFLASMASSFGQGNSRSRGNSGWAFKT